MQYALIILVLALGSVGYLYREEIKSHTTTQVALAQSESLVSSLKLEIEVIKVKQATLAGRNNLAYQELKQAKAEIETFKGRQKSYIEKPEIVAKLINRDFIKDQKELACVTGDTSACQ